LAAAASVLFAVFLTWPQATSVTSLVASHHDTLFSIWRLSWVAHALQTDPRHLFDANIFHPESGTLAYSDAMLLEGFLAAPLIWGGLSTVTAYNLLLLGGIAACGVAMFVLARHLTGTTAPALVAAAVFTMAPYRTEHFMHLELQWAMWMPLMFWAIHRAVDQRWPLGALLTGLFLWLQMLSSVYYGIFLALAASSLVMLLLLVDLRRTARALPWLLAGAVVAGVLTVPYAIPYTRAAGLLGERQLSEITEYSAQPISYLASPPQNWLWGWTSEWGGAELHLFPGLTAIGLTLAGLFSRFRRPAFVYAALALILAELSLGSNGRLYSALLAQGSWLHGLRAPSRLGLFVACALAMGAGFGAQAIAARCRPSYRKLAWLAIASLLAVEYANRGLPLTSPGHAGRATLFNVLRSAGPGVVIELPVPLPEALPGPDPFYQYWSSNHWYPLVNGYSGYYPESYLQTLELIRRFPDDASIRRLKRLKVRYIVLHRHFFGPEEYSIVFDQLRARQDVLFLGTFFDPLAEASLFILQS
jgi:hypothetical protein